MSRVRVYIFLTLVLSFNQLSQHVFAQSERFQHISADNGLSHKYVFSILPDSLGRIWMGTYDGLNLYNGYEFKVFKSDPDDPYSLSHNWVTTIFKDKNGYMWVGTNGGGLNRLLEPVYIKKQDTIIHRSDWNFESFVYDASDSFSLSSNSITSICQDDYGRLWIGTFGGGLNKMVLDSDGNPRFYHYEAIDDDHESIPVNDIRTLMKDRSGSIWAGTDGGGLFKFMPASKPGKKPDFVLYPRKSSGKYALTNDNIGELEEDGQGNIWIGTRGAGCFILPVDEKDADPEEAMFLKLNNANARDQLTNNIIEDIFHASD
ncbi:MAG: ligand-binding sensor domain-containing protein, partial [Bacteroidota bacterium]